MGYKPTRMEKLYVPILLRFVIIPSCVESLEILRWIAYEGVEAYFQLLGYEGSLNIS